MGQVVRPGVPRWPDAPETDALGFVRSDAAVELAEVAAAFRWRVPDASVVQDDRLGVKIVAAFADGWMVRVSLTSGTRSDAKHMAIEGFLRNHPQAAEIAGCDRIVEVMISDPQESDAGFEALDAARGWLLTQTGVIAVQPNTGDSL